MHAQRVHAYIYIYVYICQYTYTYISIHRNSMLHCNWGFLCPNLSLPQNNLGLLSQLFVEEDKQPKKPIINRSTINHPHASPQGVKGWPTQQLQETMSSSLGGTNGLAGEKRSWRTWPAPKRRAAVFSFGGVQPAVSIKVNELIGLVAVHARNNINWQSIQSHPIYHGKW